MTGGGPSIWLRETITPQDVYMHGADRVVVHLQSEFQEICIVDTAHFGRKLFLDGIVQSSEVDEFIYHESLVQPAALAVGGPRTALVLGGGEGATIREVLRWPSVERVVMVDIDGELIAQCRQHLGNHHQGSFEDPRVELIVGDAVAYLAGTPERFDVVVSDMTDPVEDGPATFCFTVEFFAAISRVLQPGGVVAVQAGPMSPAEIGLHAKVIRTLRAAFAEVISYPCMAAVYGRPLGFCVASSEPIVARLDPTATAPLIAGLEGGLRHLTADLTVGLMATPAFVEAAVGEATSVYRDDAPPATVGAAGWERD